MDDINQYEINQDDINQYDINQDEMNKTITVPNGDALEDNEDNEDDSIIKLSEHDNSIDQNKSVKRKGKGKSGEGQILAICKKNLENSLAEQNNLLKELKSLYKNNYYRNNWERDELNIYNRVFTSEPTLHFNSFYNQIYNNSLHKEKWNLIEYDNYIKNIGPMLSYYSYSNGSNWASISHVAGSMRFLKQLFPYESLSEDVVFDDDNSIKGLNLTLTNKICPKLQERYYGVSTSNKGNIGGEKGLLTYAEKFSNVYNFFSTIKVDANEHLREHIENFLEVLKSYKSQYSFFIHKDYSFVWDLVLDCIGHVYLIELKIVPDKKFFTLTNLNNVLSLKKILNNKGLFLSKEYAKANIEEEDYYENLFYFKDYYTCYRKLGVIIKNLILINYLPGYEQSYNISQNSNIKIDSSRFILQVNNIEDLKRQLQLEFNIDDIKKIDFNTDNNNKNSVGKITYVRGATRQNYGGAAPRPPGGGAPKPTN